LSFDKFDFGKCDLSSPVLRRALGAREDDPGSSHMERPSTSIGRQVRSHVQAQNILPSTGGFTSIHRVVKQWRRAACQMGRTTFLLFSFSLLVVFAVLANNMIRAYAPVALLPVIPRVYAAASCVSPSVDLSWYPSPITDVNSLSSLENNSGIYGFVFNSSTDPAGTSYGTYNWCNMPHVRSHEYKKPSSGYKLEYVEVVSKLLCVEEARLTCLARFTATTNARPTHPIHFPTSPTPGNVTTRRSSTTACLTQTANPLRLIVSSNFSIDL
jgi:hypothetical protein